MERTTLMLPPALRERAARLAKGRQQSLGELIRELLERELAGERETPTTIDPIYADQVVWHGRG